MTAAATPITELYRHYNVNGQLLYVGISLTTAARLSAHQSQSYWFKDVAVITIERFPTRADALTAESFAILIEKPLHNKDQTSTHRRQQSRQRVHNLLHTIEPGPILDCVEAAAMMRLDRKTLRIQAREDRAPVAPVAGMKPFRWRRVEVEAWVRGEAL